MKFWTSQCTFDHPWDTVVNAAARKYPNPHTQTVTGIDVLHRKIEHSAGENGLTSRRGSQSSPNLRSTTGLSSSTTASNSLGHASNSWVKLSNAKSRWTSSKSAAASATSHHSSSASSAAHNSDVGSSCSPILRSERVLQTHWSIPSWVTSLIGLTNPNYSHESSVIDPAKQLMVLETRNVDCRHFITVDEKLTYKPHPEDPQKTILEQEAVVNVRGVPLRDYCEKLFLSVYENNVTTGRDGLEWVINNARREYEDLSNTMSQEVHGLSQKLTNELKAVRIVNDVNAATK